MARDPNLVTITGRLGGDPTVRQTKSGTTVANVSIASNGRQQDQQSKQWEDGPTTWWKCVAWRDLAEHIAASYHKGDQVVALARPKPASYQDQRGNTVNTIEWQLEDLAASTRHATVQIARNQTTNRQTGGFAGGQAAGDYPTDPYAGTWPADDPWQ